MTAGAERKSALLVPTASGSAAVPSTIVVVPVGSAVRLPVAGGAADALGLAGGALVGG
jgi:hypothetical protein